VDFPAVLKLIKGRSCKFIIFIDDLAFEDSEESYTVLKSVLEGGVKQTGQCVNLCYFQQAASYKGEIQ